MIWLRLATGLCFVAALAIGMQAVRFRQRAADLEDQLVATGERVSELRLESRHAEALLLQYKQRCEISE